MTEKDLLSQLEQVRTHRRLSRHHRHTHSRLDRHRAEIEALVQTGASSYDIALWLRQYKRIKVHPTTVWRALKRWQNNKETT